MLYELLTQREVGTIVQCLRRLVDELTPLLKHEIENLPPQQRRIIHALMENGGAAQPTDLVERTRLPLNAITTQLGRLKEAQFVEVLGGGKGRTANYTVPDKLFAVWYQMRYLNRNRRRIEVFVEVLRVWFEEEERLVTLSSLVSPGQRGVPQVLRESATAAEYFAASLKGTPHERLATGLSDYTEVIEMDGVSRDQIVRAFINRGGARGKLGDFQGAISDFTAVLGIEDVSKEDVVSALVNRGAAKGSLGDLQGAIFDCTSVVEMEGTPKEEVARALFNRGYAKVKLSDLQGAISDYTLVIEMRCEAKEQAARALFNRGLTFLQQNEALAAIADWVEVIDLGTTKDNLAVDAAIAAYRVLWARDDYSGAKAIVAKLGCVLSSLTTEMASLTAMRFLSSIKSPRMKDAWAAAWRVLAETQRHEVAEALQFLKPVCDVLEGKDRAVLNGLPPEQREFAEDVLRSFDAEAPVTD